MVETERVEVNLKTLTPVYIGTGDVFMSSEYFMDTDSNNRSTFNRINLTKYFNSLNKSNQDKFSNDLLNPKYKLHKISDEFVRYYAWNRCSTKPNPGNEIHENIKILDKPYIPGSSIKGAIESALLYNSLNFADIKEMFTGFSGVNHKIINNFFKSSSGHNILRFLQISDTDTVPRPYIYDFQPFKVKKGGGTINLMKLYCETISDNALKSSISIKYDSEIFKDLNLEDKKYMLEIDYIKESLYEFAESYIKHEIEFAEKYNLFKYYLKFYNGLKSKNSPESPLIRLGATTGVFTKTLLLKIKERDSLDYFERYKKSIKGRKAGFDFPITRTVINSNKRPTGWVQLTFK